MITNEINVSNSLKAKTLSNSSATTVTLDKVLNLSIKNESPATTNTSTKLSEKILMIEDNKSEAAKQYTNSVYEKILDKYLNKSFIVEKPDLKIDTHFEKSFPVRRNKRNGNKICIVL